MTRPPNRFRVGDIVRCVSQPHYGDLSLGTEYIISSMYWNNGTRIYGPQWWIVVSGKAHAYQECKFVLERENDSVESSVALLIRSKGKRK